MNKKEIYVEEESERGIENEKRREEVDGKYKERKRTKMKGD
jgi:hypothetical protein